MTRMIYKTDKPKKQQPKPKKQPAPPIPPMIVEIDPDEWPEVYPPIKDDPDGG